MIFCFVFTLDSRFFHLLHRNTADSFTRNGSRAESFTGNGSTAGYFTLDGSTAGYLTLDYCTDDSFTRNRSSLQLITDFTPDVRYVQRDRLKRTEVHCFTPEG